jgi:hypothetical protein
MAAAATRLQDDRQIWSCNNKYFLKSPITCAAACSRICHSSHTFLPLSWYPAAAVPTAAAAWLLLLPLLLLGSLLQLAGWGLLLLLLPPLLLPIAQALSSERRVLLDQLLEALRGLGEGLR